jgi:hypothetical protein
MMMSSGPLETTSEQINRLKLMTNPRGKWDLSINDIAAIRMALTIIDTNMCGQCWHGLDCHVSARGTDGVCDACFDHDTLVSYNEHQFVAVQDAEVNL